jgi:peroxiredoxin
MDLRLPDADGREVALADLRGTIVVLAVTRHLH